MAKKNAPAAPAAPDGAPPKKSKLKLIIILVLGIILLVGISVGATLFFLGGGKSGEEHADEAHAEASAPVKETALYEELTPAFVVNFNVNGRQRYMQVSVALMARDKAALDSLKAHMPVLRNNLVMLFSSQEFATLMTPVGKEMLRQQATASVQALAEKEVGKTVVEQVLFTNFVLQ